MMYPINKEEQWLLKFLRADADPELITVLKNFSESDWNSVIKASYKHLVLPQLYNCLQEPEFTPYIHADIKNQLKGAYLRHAARNTQFYYHLSDRLQVLKDAQIPVIVLKGAHLGSVIYNNIFLRSLSDVDLLFRNEDLERAQQCIINAGFSCKDTQLPIDYHWNIETDLSINIKAVWKRATPAIIADVDVLVLSPEDMILHLCIHLAYHHLFQMAGIRSLYDIRQLIERYKNQIEWEQVIERSKEWGAVNTVYLSLLLSEDLLGVRVPKSVMTELKPDDYDEAKMTWAMEQIFNNSLEEVLSLSPNFWRLWGPGSLKQKINSFEKLIFPSTEFKAKKDPSFQGPGEKKLYYMDRLLNHLKPYIKTLWFIIIRKDAMVRKIRHHNREMKMRYWLSS